MCRETFKCASICTTECDGRVGGRPGGKRVAAVCSRYCYFDVLTTVEKAYTLAYYYYTRSELNLDLFFIRAGNICLFFRFHQNQMSF